MATFIDPKAGKVQPPLNITAPTPGIDLNNFQWRTLDDKLNPPPFEGSHVDDFANDEKSLSTNGQKVFSREVVAAGPSNGAVQLPPQLAQQIGLSDAKQRPKPDFPLDRFQGAYAGNGFNLIFRPKTDGPKGLEGLDTGPDPKKLNIKGNNPNDNILELNLTTEQLSFGGTVGNIPNRGLRAQGNLDLTGLPYLQTVQDVTNPPTGNGDHADRDWGIHFEPGMWLNVPAANFQGNRASIVRMASIPHGTTINAQGFAPKKRTDTVTGGEKGRPKFEAINTTPFKIGIPDSKFDKLFTSMAEENNADLRLPQNLDKFGKKGSQRITTEIIKNPNLVLEKAIEKLDIAETITFTVATGPEVGSKQTVDVPNGGGTANIAFLEGQNQATENARAVRMTATYWIERVMYEVTVPGNLAARRSILLRPKMPLNSTAPTPEFNIITGTKGNQEEKTIKVPGTQIQVSQNVTLNFGTLSWPHVSVSTLVPSDPQTIDLSLPESEWGKL
ncbi:hypothetical protein E8E14_007841 [Neopestalotiopsis sp. 37M]|nr:hypothetical protein E8E14_007841 [Neopestalotiopsis sp. 37M]